jgi:biotin carboxylase
MARALREFHALPIKTTIRLRQRLMENWAFQEGGIDIHCLERLLW